MKTIHIRNLNDTFILQIVKKIVKKSFHKSFQKKLVFHDFDQICDSIQLV